MNFIVQKIGGKIIHDFSFELQLSRDYYAWLNDDLVFGEINITYVDDNIPDNLKDPDNYIPIGSVEFVSDFLRKYYPKSTKALIPINVPEALFKYAGRFIKNIYKEEDLIDFKNKGEDFYIKSLYKIKDPLNGFSKLNNNLIGYQVSEKINIQSEWRVFIFKNKILHISNYSGETLLFPNPEIILKMVDEYSSDSPKAYTLDVGVNNKGTFVIECHRFFSCGLYGFSDSIRLPKMFSQEWFEMKNLT